MIFSDLYLNGKTKIEILPSDRLGQEVNVLAEGDRLVSVFRSIGVPYAAMRLQKEFTNEFQDRHLSEKLSIADALISTIQAFNFSLLNPPADRDLRPESGSMVLVVYIDQAGDATFAQVGPITLKQRIDGRLTALTENHTFDNQVEIDRLVNSKFYRENCKNSEKIERINSIAIEQVLFKEEDLKPGKLLPGIPSRFIGHPSCCGEGGEYGETFINTKSFVRSFKLE